MLDFVCTVMYGDATAKRGIAIGIIGADDTKHVQQHSSNTTHTILDTSFILFYNFNQYR